MPIAINGSGTITGVSVGGLPDGIVDTDMIANSNVTAGKLASGVGGKIVQVKSVSKLDTFSVASPTALQFYDVKGLDNLQITDFTGSDIATAQDITITGINEAGGTITVTPADNIAPVAWDGAWFYTDNGAVGLISNADGGSDFNVTLTVDILPPETSICL